MFSVQNTWLIFHILLVQLDIFFHYRVAYYKICFFFFVNSSLEMKTDQMSCQSFVVIPNISRGLFKFKGTFANVIHFCMRNIFNVFLCCGVHVCTTVCLLVTGDHNLFLKQN